MRRPASARRGRNRTMRFAAFRHRADGQRLHAIEVQALRRVAGVREERPLGVDDLVDGSIAGLRLRHDAGPDHIPGQLLNRARRIRIVADQIAAAVAKPDERSHQLDVGVRRGGVPAMGAPAGGGAVVAEPLRVPIQIALGQFQRHAAPHPLQRARGATTPMALSRRFIQAAVTSGRTAMDHLDRLRVCAARVGAAPALPAGLADVLFDLGLRLAEFVHGAVRHLAPVREPDLQRGIPERLVDRVQVRLQLLEPSEPCHLPPNQLRRGIHCSARSNGAGMRTSVSCGSGGSGAGTFAATASAESSALPCAATAAICAKRSQWTRQLQTAGVQRVQRGVGSTRGNRALRSARRQASAIPASESRCDSA